MTDIESSSETLQLDWVTQNPPPLPTKEEEASKARVLYKYSKGHR
jgi:hypothetical protein